MEYLSVRADYPLMAVPFATSIVLARGGAAARADRRPPGRDVKLAGPTPWAALAVGLAMAAMRATRTFRPPRPSRPSPPARCRSRSARSDTAWSVARRGRYAGGEAGLSCQRGLGEPMPLAVAHQHQAAVVERRERRTVADRDQRHVGKALGQQGIERGF